jgi:hypothetical protein
MTDPPTFSPAPVTRRGIGLELADMLLKRTFGINIRRLVLWALGRKHVRWIGLVLNENIDGDRRRVTLPMFQNAGPSVSDQAYSLWFLIARCNVWGIHRKSWMFSIFLFHSLTFAGPKRPFTTSAMPCARVAGIHQLLGMCLPAQTRNDKIVVLRNWRPLFAWSASSTMRAIVWQYGDNVDLAQVRVP